jgi:MFS family permease
MLTRWFDLWLKWPLSARWISGILVVWIVSALPQALRERRPAAAFGENLVALGIYYGFAAGSIALSIWVGPKIAERTGQSWLAWVAGIGMFVAAVFAQRPVGEFFGVSEQLEELANPECYTDWDGRSNPTVCD